MTNKRRSREYETADGLAEAITTVRKESPVDSAASLGARAAVGGEDVVYANPTDMPVADVLRVVAALGYARADLTDSAHAAYVDYVNGQAEALEAGAAFLRGLTGSSVENKVAAEPAVKKKAGRKSGAGKKTADGSDRKSDLVYDPENFVPVKSVLVEVNGEYEAAGAKWRDAQMGNFARSSFLENPEQYGVVKHGTSNYIHVDNVDAAKTALRTRIGKKKPGKKKVNPPQGAATGAVDQGTEAVVDVAGQ